MMMDEQRVREIVRDEIELMNKEALEEWLARLVKGEPVYINPAWGMEEVFPTVKKRAKRRPTLQE